jgi:hypothetical protein
MSAPVLLDPAKLAIPLGGAVALAGLAISFHLFLQGQFQALRDQFIAINRRLDRIEEQASDRWSGTDMRLWTLELSRQNPTLAVPPPAPATTRRSRPEPQ